MVRGARDLGPGRLVFSDDTWTARLIAGMRSGGLVAPFVIDGPANRVIFDAWMEQP